MKHLTIEAFDIPDAYRKTIKAIRDQGDRFEVKIGSELTETLKLSVSVLISHPGNRPLVDDRCNTTDTIKVQEYALRYLWLDAKTPDEEYTYGSRLRAPIDQIQQAIELFAKEPNNRQVTLTVRVPSDIYSPHPPCLTMIDLEILEGRLNLCGYYRSWDAYAGFPENVAGLQLFNEALVQEINDARTWDGPDLKPGRLTLHSKNCHLYKRQYAWVDKLGETGADSRRIAKERGV